MQWQRGNHTIDTDRLRLDMDVIVAWLRGSYWASTRPSDAIHRSWAAADPVFGLYAGAELAGCARVLTDFVAIAYLADVYLAPHLRGSGLGLWLVETIVAHPELQTLKWLLHTRDAHGLYRRIGFAEPSPAVMERPRPVPNA